MKEELTMSGHSKWHNIQAKKGKADAARGKIFTKLGRELLIAVKQMTLIYSVVNLITTLVCLRRKMRKIYTS